GPRPRGGAGPGGRGGPPRPPRGGGGGGPGGAPRGRPPGPGGGGPGFGAPATGGGGIAAALEGLTDEPLTAAPAARPQAPAARPGVPAAGRPAGPATPASRPAAAPGGGAGLSDDKLRAVYDAYVTAKKRNQEDTSKMSYESVAANLRKQVPDLLKQHNAKNVEFKVVIKDGKATLKAVPK
ncbi:MXAN_5187 C-terminal domain-containing protein, partial [Stigmatella hybrida]|uniref:MXAN_5187 C-terminal domain-containing protein n=1 Tax=Stigmatella hybrida TaxID=394097 RepID=UPI00295EC0E6